MSLALPNATGDLFSLSDDLIEQALQASRESPRKRMLFPIHRHQDDLVQRMLNFFQPGTYVPPHMHPRDSASETIFVMRGSLGFLHLSEDGEIVEKVKMTMGDMVDIVPRLWHSIVALEPDTIILEIKRGPYDDEDKVFAPWAPEEGSGEVGEFLARYEAYFQ